MNFAFLLLCTCLALFITLSGLTRVTQLSDLPVHLAFLPVTLYLVFTTVHRLLHRHRSPDVSLSHRKLQLTILFLILAVLAFTAFKSSPPPPPPTPASSTPLILTAASPPPTPTAAPVTLTITASNSTLLINVRQAPASTSALVRKSAVGSVYPVLASQSGWYKISFDHTSGWVSGRNATLSGQLP